MYNLKEVGKRVKNLRKKLNMSQEKLAEELNYSHYAICKIERGNQALTIDYGLIYADYFGVSLDYIYKGEQPVDDEITEKYNSISNDKKDLAKSVMLCSLDAFLQ